jgi:hypothetical protein
MPSTTISNLGVTAFNAPIIKRAVGTLSDGSCVMMVPDTNIAGLVGDDVTGTPKIRFYKSDITRTTWALNFTYTPSPQAMSSTKPFVGSIAIGSDDRIGLVYQGTDNSLNFMVFTFGSGTWTSGTLQTISAANAVTNRYRVIDIDYAGTADPAVIVYESKASAGPSCWVRVYIRNTDATTWRKAFEDDFASHSGGSLPIYPNSEDVSISYNNTGIVSNVGQLLIYYTSIGSYFDNGDVIKEISYNVSTGTDGSATTLGTWPKFNQNLAGGARRGWIFKTTNNTWQVAFSVGTARPAFQACRLVHGTYTAPTIDSTAIGSSVQTSSNGVVIEVSANRPQMSRNANAYTAIACTYNDNRVMFGFITSNTPPIGINLGLGYTLSAIVFRYNDAAILTASYVSTQMRALDNYFTYGQQPVAVYGSANNRNQTGDLKFNFLAIYGYTGNTQTSAFMNKARAIVDTFYDPPTVIGPTQVSATDSPILQVRVQNTALYPNVHGKIEWNLARDAAFSTDLRDISEPDANYRFFGSTTNGSPSPINVALKLSGVGTQRLYSGTWYMRSRVVSDLGQLSVWSATSNFSVSHPPSAFPVSPVTGSMNAYISSGNTFSWTYSDTEPGDAQTAYRLLITRLDTGSSVLDTGKVTSSINGVTTVLSSSLKDIQLQWQVALWDTDDVQGPFSTAVHFMVGDAPTVLSTAPTDGSTVATAVPTVSWTFTGGGTRTQRAFRVRLIALDVFDIFSRTVASGWGSSTSGAVWTAVGTAADFNVGSNVATIAQSTTAVNKYVLLQGSTVTNVQQSADMATAALSTGAAQHTGLVARYVDANNYFRAQLSFDLGAQVNIQIVQRVGGTETTLGNVTTGITHVAGTYYNLTFSIVGNVLKAKVWVVGTAQPSGWMIVTSSAANVLASAGYIGVYSRQDTSNTNGSTTHSIDGYSRWNPDVPVVLGDSGWNQSAATTYTFSSNVLTNGTYGTCVIDVQDTQGIIGGDDAAFQTAWTAPADATQLVVLDNYGATVSWTNSAVDINFIAWRVYRRYMVPAIVDLDSDNTANTWVLLYETTVNQTNYSYKDYLMPLNKSVDYAVVQVADRFGSLIESPLASITTVTNTASRYYFIPQVAVGTIASYEAGNITDDSYTDEIESEVIHVIGRGRQVQIGDDLGVSGTLTIQLRNPAGNRPDREFIQYLASSKNLGVWMKNPFGDVKLVKFQNVGVKFIPGTGSTEMSDLTVPYIEVFTDPVVTR